MKAKLSGIFLIVAATLLLELSLTRIFSVTMWYYFAFLAVSLALFGLAASAIAAYAFESFFVAGRSARHRALAALWFSLATPLALWAHLQATAGSGAPGFWALAATYLTAALPFFCAGLCVTLALAHDPRRADRIYAADLIGAGCGAFLVVGLLDRIDGPGALLVIAAIGAAAAVAFALEAGRRRLALLAAAVALLWLAAAGLQSARAPLRIEWSKGQKEQARVAEVWNAYSRLAAFDTDRPLRIDDWDRVLSSEHRRTLHAWGVSPRYPGAVPRQVSVNIDATAATPITYAEDPGATEHVLADITSLAYAILERPEVLVIGPGGGRDLTGALAAGARSVTAVELNRDLVELVEQRFGALSGRPYSDPRVDLVIDDGRSHLARSPRRYDLLMASMVDTWAANAAGAFSLSENSLYTREAFDVYWERLRANGLLSVTRFYFTPPRQTLRLFALALDLLRRRAASDPSRHLFVAGLPLDFQPGAGVATLLLSKRPFAPEMLAELRAACARLGFRVLVEPGRRPAGAYGDLLAAADPEAFYRRYRFDVSPPRDDRPFFFHVLKPGDFLRGASADASLAFNAQALRVVVQLLIVSGGLVLIFLLGPLLLRRGAPLPPRGKTVLLAYFACLGLGFVLLELPLMQRFILFLGHPIYALAVVLAAILVTSGVGSYLGGRWFGDRPRRALPLLIGLLVVLAMVYRGALGALLGELMGLETTAKVAVTAGLLLPLGLLLGMPLPLALRHLERLPHGAGLIPWAWGVNGALSVFATVLATTTSLAFGFSAALLLGQAAYLAALLLSLRFPAADAP
ncbi:MAG TPA: hypothetical protein VGB99_18875 [Acidobacteriota bacterium]